MIFQGFSNKTKLQGVSEGFEKVTIVCHQDEIKFQTMNLTAPEVAIQKAVIWKCTLTKWIWSYKK